MKKIMAVYDVDSRYADRFAEFANRVSRYYLKWWRLPAWKN